MRPKRQSSRRQEAAAGRLQSRPGGITENAVADRIAPGRYALDSSGQSGGILVVPPGYDAATPAPLVVMLHGAGGNADGGLRPFLPLSDEFGLLLLAVNSQGATWDMLMGRYGPDVARIDDLLAETFGRCAIDPAHIALEGFSDGASYALSLGLMNGGLFTHVIAFSPGFAAPAWQEGAPRLYVAHGTHDQVLPVDRCSRRLVPSFQQAGYDVTYHEFDGPHTVPESIALEAAQWFTKS